VFRLLGLTGVARTVLALRNDLRGKTQVRGQWEQVHWIIAQSVAIGLRACIDFHTGLSLDPFRAKSL